MRTSILNKALVHALLLVGVAIIVYPFYLTLISVFKTPLEAADDYFSLPQSLNMDNLRIVFSLPSIGLAIRNSVLITVVSAVVISILVPMVSYPISRNIGKAYYRLLFYLFVSGLFVPIQMLMLPIVKLMTKLELTNPFGLILIYLTASLIQGVFLCVGYLRTVPFELEEAAEIDGCGAARSFFSVIYPLMRPIVVTLLIINTLWIWNDFILPMILLNKDSSYWTLPLLQYNLKARVDLGTTVQYAAYAIGIFPILVLYLSMQKHIIGGLTDGSLKS